jgi:hypothetical protein
MSDGFAANAQFFKLSFLDENAVAMDMQFKELLTTLWMKAGAVGECPVIESSEIDDFYIFPENKMAILKEEEAYMAFKKAMGGMMLFQPSLSLPTQIVTSARCQPTSRIKSAISFIETIWIISALTTKGTKNNENNVSNIPARGAEGFER